MGKYIVGISGASGFILGLKTAKALIKAHHEVFLVISEDAKVTARYEIDQTFQEDHDVVKWFPEEMRSSLTLCNPCDLSASIASGTFPIQGMVVAPCSMTSLAALSIGLADTLLRRAADVTLKEKRALILVPREAPFSQIHLANMLKLSQVGATILPPMPAWYAKPKTIADVEDHIVGRILDALGVTTEYQRWS